MMDNTTMNNEIELKRRMFEAMEYLEPSFPAFDREYLGFLVTRAMVSAIDPSAVQAFLFAYGPSGSGKTATPELASELLGDSMYEVRIDDDMKNAEQRLGYAIKANPKICCFDEFDKLYHRPRKDRLTITQLLLSMKRNFVFNQKFKDDQMYEVTTMFVLTGTAIPAEFASEQLARRTVARKLKELPPGVNWLTTSGGINGWRCRTESNRIASALMVSRAYDLVKACDFNHLRVEQMFEVYRLDQYLNEDVKARHDAYRRLYRVWLHSVRAANDARDIPGTVVDGSKCGDYDPDWGDRDYMHSDKFSGNRTTGWLDILHPGVSRFQILEDIFMDLDMDSPPGQIRKRFQFIGGEQSFVGIFGLTGRIGGCELHIRHRSKQLGIKFILYPLTGGQHNANQMDMWDILDLPSEQIEDLGDVGVYTLEPVDVIDHPDFG
jgi:hypothetical protein